jgi:hypothetical protein
MTPAEARALQDELAGLAGKAEPQSGWLKHMGRRTQGPLARPAVGSLKAIRQVRVFARVRSTRRSRFQRVLARLRDQATE